MAWRIDKQVIRGEIDNRTRGRVTGRIWLSGSDDPIVLDLEGDGWRDVAGHRLQFSNPSPTARDLAGLADRQEGSVGDITASRKVRVPDCPEEEFEALLAARKPFPTRWANALYLEWFSDRNGRVVIESADYELELDGEADWEMTPEEETAQRLANGRALTGFVERAGTALAARTEGADDADAFDDDAPQSRAEAEAEDETARMNLLLDRVDARIEREGRDHADFDEIYWEERERLRKERGEPEEKPLTPEQEAEREAWIEEMNAAAEEAMAEAEAESWKGEDPFERDRHPLVDRCIDLSVRIHHEVEAAGWLPEGAHEEHPIAEIVSASMCAGPKLGGALSIRGEDEWPPDPLFAGDTLVRLKKGRAYLRDAIRGLDSADDEDLATPEWRAETRRQLAEILAEVHQLIAEVREVLAEEDDR